MAFYLTVLFSSQGTAEILVSQLFHAHLAAPASYEVLVTAQHLLPASPERTGGFCFRPLCMLEFILTHPYSSPGRGVLSVITRYCCWYFIYYQFIITDIHFIWKVNIASPIHGIIFLCLPFTHRLHINFPSRNKRSVCSGSLVNLNLITSHICFYHQALLRILAHSSHLSSLYQANLCLVPR